MLIIALIVGLVVGIVWYLHHKLTYWRRKGIQTPGLFYQWHYHKREIPLYDLELTQKYGPMYGVLEGLTPVLMLSDLDLVRELLVKDFSSFPNRKPFRLGEPVLDLSMFTLDGDDEWRRIRALISPTFTSGKLRSMEGLVNDCIKVFKKNLGVVADSGEVIDAKKYFNSLAFDVICRCAYGTRIDSLHDPQNPIQKNFESLFTGRWELVFNLFFPKLAAWTGIQKRALRPFQFFVAMSKTLIEERTQAQAQSGDSKGRVYNDFLQIMIDANQEAMKEDTQVGTQSKKSLTTEEMMAQSMTFLLGGFDATATILAASAYHLAKNPQWQEKLIAELSNLNEYTHDSVMNHKCLEAVLKETFRLSPPAIRVERECTAPVILGSVRVEPGTIVSVPVFAVHRDQTQYKNPEVFDPDRFMNGDSVDHHPYAYLPFGGGPRMCIAQRFALMEVKLALAQILKEYRFEATAETKMSYTPKSFDILAPKPIMLKVKRH